MKTHVPSTPEPTTPWEMRSIQITSHSRRGLTPALLLLLFTAVGPLISQQHPGETVSSQEAQSPEPGAPETTPAPGGSDSGDSAAGDPSQSEPIDPEDPESTKPSSPELKPTTATDPDSKSETDEDSEKEPVGRLLITTDAPATIWFGGESLGELQPEETLEHEVTRTEGEVKAVAIEALAAQIKRPYSFENDAKEERDEAEEPENDGQAVARKVRKHADGLDLIEIKFRMAKAIRTLRKSERQDKIYPDFKDGVMWAREDNRTNVTWKVAGEYCSKLDLGGHRDWRLPSLGELSSIQVMWSQNPLKTIDPIRLTDCCPWSSTEIDELRAWNFNFRFRKPFEGRKGHSFGMRALCIRDLTEAEITEHEEAVLERERKKKEEKKLKKAEKKARKKAGKSAEEADDASDDSNDVGEASTEGSDEQPAPPPAPQSAPQPPLSTHSS